MRVRALQRCVRPPLAVGRAGAADGEAAEAAEPGEGALDRRSIAGGDRSGGRRGHARAGRAEGGTNPSARGSPPGSGRAPDRYPVGGRSVSSGDGPPGSGWPAGRFRPRRCTASWAVGAAGPRIAGSAPPTPSRPRGWPGAWGHHASAPASWCLPGAAPPVLRPAVGRIGRGPAGRLRTLAGVRAGASRTSPSTERWRLLPGMPCAVGFGPIGATPRARGSREDLGSPPFRGHALPCTHRLPSLASARPSGSSNTSSCRTRCSRAPTPVLCRSRKRRPRPFPEYGVRARRPFWRRDVLKAPV